MYLRNKFNEGFHHNTHLEQEQQQQQQHTEDQHGASLFNSWTLKKKKKRQNAHTVFKNKSLSTASIPSSPLSPPTQQQLSKIAINTTINIQPLNHANNKSNSKNPIQPPIITQYPPKPLKYSPVEPLPDDDDDDNGNSSTGAALHYKKSKTLHRLSLPLLKLTAQQQQQQPSDNSHTLQRRRSDSDLLNRNLVVEKTSHSMLHSISKKWNKLLSTCIHRGVKKKE